jgi:hypothetical protein
MQGQKTAVKNQQLAEIAKHIGQLKTNALAQMRAISQDNLGTIALNDGRVLSVKEHNFKSSTLEKILEVQK